MIRNAKMLGLMVVAALAVSAFVASAASAANFTASSYPVNLKGTQTTSHKFSVGGGSVTCTTADFSGSQSAASESVTINATYENCTAFGFINSTVTGFSSTGCDYTFYASGKADLDCASGDVKIDASVCSVTLESSKNQNIGTNTYTNNIPAGSGDVTVDTNVTGIHAVVTSGFGCPIAGGTYTNATYTGTTRMEGTNSKGENVNIDVG